MLDTRRSRGWIIVAVVAVWLLGGATVGLLGSRALERERDEFIAAADARFADMDPATFEALVVENVEATWMGESSELDALLVVDGRSPQVIRQIRLGIDAEYEIEAWGRSDTFVVSLSDEGYRLRQD